MSHPVWVRGLKLEYAVLVNSPALVAPRVGAWIETCHSANRRLTSLSHPVWVRGLKQKLVEQWPLFYMESHPVWVRGLKLKLR